MTSQDQSVGQEFIERLGLSLEAEGLPRIAGRIMGFLLLREESARASEISEALQVSAASVSTNIRLLERLGAVQKISMRGERAAFYEITSDPYGSMVRGQLERTRKLHGVIAEARRKLPADQQSGRARLGQMERFHRLAIHVTEDLLGQWDVTAPADAEQP